MRVITVNSDLGKFKVGTKLDNFPDIAEYICLRVNEGRDKASFIKPSDSKIRAAMQACPLPEDADPKVVETDIVNRITGKAATKTAGNGAEGNATEPEASQTPPQELTEQVLTQLAELGEMPVGASRERFFQRVRDALRTAHELAEIAKQWQANEKAEELRAAAASLYKKLGDLNSDDQWIEGIPVDELQEKLRRPASLLNIRMGKPPLPIVPQRPKDGRPKDSVENPPFQRFIFNLCAAAGLEGGKFTKTGLTKALKVLRANLPDDFRPSATTLQGIAKASSEFITGLKEASVLPDDSSQPPLTY